MIVLICSNLGIGMCFSSDLGVVMCLKENWVCIGGEWCVGLLAGGWLRKRDRFERIEEKVNFYIILLYS